MENTLDKTKPAVDEIISKLPDDIDKLKQMVAQEMIRAELFRKMWLKQYRAGISGKTADQPEPQPQIKKPSKIIKFRR
jgi:hypothetical protein